MRAPNRNHPNYERSTVTVYTSDAIRNIALVGHGDSGKTTLVDALLVTAGDISRIGSVENGSTVSDFTEEEHERQISINTSLVFIEHEGTKINVLDTPGFADFLAEVKGALRVVEGAVVTLKADSGLEVGTEQVWRFAREAGVPRLLVVNKLDKEHTDFDGLVQQGLVDRPWRVAVSFAQVRARQTSKKTVSCAPCRWMSK